jgi:hypothetical protein
MGDCQNGDVWVNFDRALKLKFLGSQVTTDAGLPAHRELDEALCLTTTGAKGVQDSRLGQNKQHGLLSLLRQSIYSRLAAYEDVNDAERLCIDPTMRHVVGGKASQPKKQAASTSEVGRVETGMHGLRAENHAKTIFTEGVSSARTARRNPAWTRNRRADWKTARRIVENPG